MRIENWSVTPSTNNPYRAPETITSSLHGQVYNHPQFDDGTLVTTSPIIDKNDKNEVVTRSGSSYELGKVDQQYEEKFPGAKERLLGSLNRQ